MTSPTLTEKPTGVKSFFVLNCFKRWIIDQEYSKDIGFNMDRIVHESTKRHKKATNLCYLCLSNEQHSHREYKMRNFYQYYNLQSEFQTYFFI